MAAHAQPVPVEHARVLLANRGHPVRQVIRVFSAGEMADGQGELILFVDRQGRAKHARAYQRGPSRIVEVADGW